LAGEFEELCVLGRCKRKELSVGSHRILLLTKLILGKGFTEPGIFIVVWVKFQNLVEGVERLFVSSQAAEAETFVEPGTCIVRVKFQGLINTAEGLCITRKTVEADGFVVPGLKKLCI
jgi:hypothetical protein